MEAKSKRERKVSSVVSLVKKSPRKPGKPIKSDLPDLVAGREVVGRDLSVLRSCPSQFVWIDGTINDFDDLKLCHQIAYKLPLPDEIKDKDEIKATEWVSLADASFTWADKPHDFAYANPTFSREHTPKREDAVGRRVKVFWTTMGRWYQGTVEAYDSTSGMHRVRFKDGDKKHYQLAQEALVWLDIPALSSGTAIKKMRAAEGQVSVGNVSNDENKPPSKEAEKPSNVCNGLMSGRKKARQGNSESSPGRKYTRRQLSQNAAEVPQVGAAHGQKLEPRPPHDLARSQLSSKKVNEGETGGVVGEYPTVQPFKTEGADSARGSSEIQASEPECPADTEKVSKIQSRLEATKSASSSSEKVQQPLRKELSSVAQIVRKNSSSPKAVNVPVFTQRSECELPNGTLLKSPAMNRKRARAESINPSGSPKACQAPGAANQVDGHQDSRGLSKRPKPRAKPSRLCKNSADFHFAESCEAIKDSRIAIWWDGNKTYFKAQVFGYISSTRCLKVLYDDGLDDKKLSVKSLKFQWLTPRATSAGATDKVHEAFKFLGAENVREPPGLAGERAASAAVEIPVKMEAASSEGLHPSRPKIEVPDPSKQALSPNSQSLTKQSSQTMMPSHVVSQGLFSAPQGKQLTASPGTGVAFFPNLPQGTHVAQHQQAIQAHASSIHNVLQAASQQLPVQRPIQCPGASQGSSGPSGIQLQDLNMPGPTARSPVAGAAAYRKPQQMNPNASSAQLPPQGAQAVGWNVSLVFRGNGKEYEGRIIAFNADNDKHRILYKDGEDEWISIASENLTWISDNKGTGYATGIPEGMSVPSGQDWIDCKIAVYWEKDDQFYSGTVYDVEGEGDQFELKVSYDDGEERFETLPELVFKYLEPPFAADEDEIAEDIQRQKSRKRGRESPDYVQEEEDVENPFIEASRQFRMPQLPLKGCASIRMRHDSSSNIRRMASGRGSLLQFSGEEVPWSPVQSPMSPQQSLGFGTLRINSLGSLRNDSRGPPVCARNINGLRTAEGYRVDVKRVRIFMNGPEQPGSQRSRTPASLTGPESKSGAQNPNQSLEGCLAAAMPAKLKAMLDRVEQAKENIRNGMPLDPNSSSLARGFSSLASMPSSRPTAVRFQSEESPSPKARGEGHCASPSAGPIKRNSSLHIKVENNQALEDRDRYRTVYSATPPPIPEHLTPPRSPFDKGGRKQSSETHSPCGSTGQQCPAPIVTNTCPEERLEGEEDHPSLTLPQTPSAKYEKVPSGPSRTGSDMAHCPINQSPCCPA